MRSDHEAVDLREIGAVLRRKTRWIVGGALGGLLLAGALLVVLHPRFDSTATVLLRSQSATGSSMLGSSGSEGGVSLGGLASVLSLDTGFETEMEILSSRSVVGAVVDSLGLQARVLEPKGWSPDSVFLVARYPRVLSTAEYDFVRSGEGYRVAGPGASELVVPGEPFTLAGAVITLREGVLPEEFTVELTGFQEAVTRTLDALTIDRAAGSVAELRYRAIDPATAAAVPNAMVAQYLARRKTTDRGVNQRRYEFLKAHTDSIADELALAGQALREHQERSGILNPEVQGEAEVEQAMELRAREWELNVEAGALGRVLEKGAEGQFDAREVAAYPALLQNASINHLLARLSDLESRRATLLERRTTNDPDVHLLDRDIRQVENQILSIARSYREGVTRQLAEVQSELAGSHDVLAALPAQVERSFRLAREVERLSETLVALQTQLVQARLAAIAEGGDVRQIDVAELPRTPSFPLPSLTLALGLMGGLFLGMVGALGTTALGSRITDTHQAERVAGAPADALSARAPLMIGGVEGARSILVVAAGEQADSGRVARRLAATASLRGQSVVLADAQTATAALPAPGQPGSGDAAKRLTNMEVPELIEPAQAPGNGAYVVFQHKGDAGSGFRAAVEDLERKFSLVIVALSTLDHPTTIAVLAPDRPVVLVAHTAKTKRRALESSANALRRMGLSTAGVVLYGDDHGE